MLKAYRLSNEDSQLRQLLVMELLHKKFIEVTIISGNSTYHSVFLTKKKTASLIKLILESLKRQEEALLAGITYQIDLVVKDDSVDDDTRHLRIFTEADNKFRVEITVPEAGAVTWTLEHPESLVEFLKMLLLIKDEQPAKDDKPSATSKSSLFQQLREHEKALRSKKLANNFSRRLQRSKRGAPRVPDKLHSSVASENKKVKRPKAAKASKR